LEIERLELRFHTLLNVAGMEFEGLFIKRSLNDLRTIMRLNMEAVVEMSMV
jgi:short-subunit dehydrogenase